MTSGVSEKTLKTWRTAKDQNDCWIRAEVVERNAIQVWCTLCAKNIERLRGFRYFSEAVINGISESALKRDWLAKHMVSGAHI